MHLQNTSTHWKFLWTAALKPGLLTVLPSLGRQGPAPSSLTPASFSASSHCTELVFFPQTPCSQAAPQTWRDITQAALTFLKAVSCQQTSSLPTLLYPRPRPERNADTSQACPFINSIDGSSVGKGPGEGRTPGNLCGPGLAQKHASRQGHLSQAQRSPSLP